MSNTALWDALGKTDPAHTKQFTRSGGFKGTALKPQWVLRKLTEQFGPVGIGWGMDKPDFQVIHGDGEVLVYCTVSAWHGRKDQTVYGVGGDKVVSKLNSGKIIHDDEAFKKAYTDALMNAFKFVGVGADIHMGQFDDNKYVQQIAEEFEREANPRITPEQVAELQGLIDQTGTDTAALCKHYKIGSLPDMAIAKFASAKSALEKKLPKKADPQRSEELDDTVPHMGN